MLAAAILDFLYFRNFYGSKGLTGSKCVVVTNFVASLNPLLRYGDFSILKMSAVRRLGFLKGRNFNSRYGGEDMCVTVPNFAAIVQIVAEIWRFFEFPTWRPPRCWIFKM